MGAQPKRRISSHRRGHRRAAISLKAPTLVDCSSCGAKRTPHVVCPHCGHYDKTK